MLTRYLTMIQVQRQDFNGRVLTVRVQDLHALAAILGTGVEGAAPRLEGLVSSISRDDRGQLEHLRLNESGREPWSGLPRSALASSAKSMLVVGVSVLRKHGRRNRPEVVARRYRPPNPSWLWYGKLARASGDERAGSDSRNEGTSPGSGSVLDRDRPG